MPGPHKGASTQCHNQQVLAKPWHQPSERDQQAREKLRQTAKIKSRAYIQLREEALQIVHKTFAPDIPVILHLPALVDNTIDTNTPPTLYVIQEGINCMPTTDYFFTSIKPAPIVVTRPQHIITNQQSNKQQPRIQFHNKPTPLQPVNQSVSLYVNQQTSASVKPHQNQHYLSGRLTKCISISLFVFTWQKRKYRRQKHRVTTCRTANLQKMKLIHVYIHLRKKEYTVQ